jgi:glycosyltransferase involved in cell wall biosynthesis
MKIFYDHQTFSLQDAGGNPRYFYELARHLQSKDGADIEIALGLNASVFPFCNLANEHTRIVGRGTKIKPGMLRYIANEAFSNMWGLTRGHFDIYHPTIYRSIPLIRRRRLVVTHHDCIHELFPNLFRNTAKILRNRKQLYAAADAIICISESSRKDLLHFYNVDVRRTHVIHHGFAAFPVLGNGSTTNLPTQPPYLLFVGARGTYKSFIAFLEAFSESGVSKNYDLVAVGGGPFTPVELAKLKALGIANCVKIIPKATDSVLSEMYRNAALLVYPSLYEGFGFPPLEAMSLGCPVLTANTSSMPEVCGDAVFYFDPKVPGALATALHDTLSDNEAMEEMKLKGYRQVSHYDWARTADQTLSVYRSVLSE